MVLHELGLKWGTDKAHLHNFCAGYEEFLAGKPISVIIEIGIMRGSSLRMWSDAYPKAKVFGLDNNRDAFIYEGNIESLYADQNDIMGTILPTLQQHNCAEMLFIDDGSHLWSHQILTHKYVWELLQSGAVYILEDLHTSLHQQIHSWAADYHMTALDYIKDFVRANNIKHKLIDNRNTRSLSMIMEKE